MIDDDDQYRLSHYREVQSVCHGHGSMASHDGKSSNSALLDAVSLIHALFRTTPALTNSTDIATVMVLAIIIG